MRNPHEMSAAEKLLRLVGIEQELNLAQGSAERDALLGEWKSILASVTSPPLHLMNEWRAAPWSAAFAAQFPSVDADHVYPWFANAINAGTRTAYEEGETAGYARASQDSAAVLKAVGDTLETIKDGIAAGVIRCNHQLTNLETRQARPLGEYVAAALQLLGR